MPTETSSLPRSFRDRMLQAREQAIIAAVNQLLADKGYEGMTVDAVAQLAGVAKASLYKHYPGKEDLAVAALCALLQQCLDYVGALDSSLAPVDKLRAVVRWALTLHLAGAMPTLPSSNGPLRQALLSHARYGELVTQLSDTMGAWIVDAQSLGALAADIPPVAVLYTLYARACDPVPLFLQATGSYSNEQIVALVERTCFEGLRAPASAR